MESIRALRATGVVGTAMFSLVACSVPAKAPPAQIEQPVYSYLTGPELARRVLGNVVRIDHFSGQGRGLGLIVGRDERGLLIATAAHVLQSPLEGEGVAMGAWPNAGVGRPLADSVRVRFCAKGFEQIEVQGQPIRVEHPAVTDIALVRVPPVPGLSIEPRVLADLGGMKAGQEAWVAGREGDCVVGGTQGQVEAAGDSVTIDDSPDGKSRFRVYVPGGLPSTSGGPVLTGAGVAGLLNRLSGAVNLVTATNIESIRQAAEATIPMTWMLERSGNLPPSSPEAARRELSEALTRYVFDAKTARLTLSGTQLNEGELAGVITSYNTAINRFIDVKNKHDGALYRLWGTDALRKYQETRTLLMDVHANFLRLTEEGLVNEMYRSRSVPASVRERMVALRVPIDQLQSSIGEFNGLVAGPYRDLLPGSKQ